MAGEIIAGGLLVLGLVIAIRLIRKRAKGDLGCGCGCSGCAPVPGDAANSPCSGCKSCTIVPRID